MPKKKKQRLSYYREMVLDICAKYDDKTNACISYTYMMSYNEYIFILHFC